MFFLDQAQFLFLAIILHELTQTRSYFRMFVREPKVKPAHLLEIAFRVMIWFSNIKIISQIAIKVKKSFQNL